MVKVSREIYLRNLLNILALVSDQIYSGSVFNNDGVYFAIIQQRGPIRAKSVRVGVFALYYKNVCRCQFGYLIT